MTSSARRQRQRRDHRDEDADAGGTPRLWKYGSRVKVRHSTAPAIVRPEPKMMCAVPRYIVLNAETRSSPAYRASWKAAEEEDRIVRAGGDDEQRQQVGRIRRQLDDAGVREHGDDAARRGQLDHHRENHQNHRGDATVEREQHHQRSPRW